MSPDTSEFEEGLQEVKEALASLFLTTVDFGKYLLVMRSECDMFIGGEPYMAYMLWLNVETGQIMSRTWNQTVCTGYVKKLYQLIQACQEHFMSGKPCLGLLDCGVKGADQEYIISQSPVPSRFSKFCHKTIAKTSGEDVYSCNECLKLDVDNTKSIVRDKVDATPTRDVASEQDGSIVDRISDDLSNLDNESTCENPIQENTNSDSQTVAELNTNLNPSADDRAEKEPKSDTQPPKAIKCPICPKWPTWNNFSGGEMLEKHLKLKHSWGVFECLQCEYKSYFLEDLIKHIQELGHTDDVKCPQCKNMFPTDMLQSHYKMCLTRNMQPLAFARVMDRCPWCYKNYRIKASLYNHMKLEHSWGIFQCLQCEFSADFIKELSQHMALREHGDDNKIQCPQCKGKFTIVDVENHYLACVSKQIIDCPWCTKVFDKNDKYKFDLHRKREHFLGTFTCPLCSFETNFGNDLIEHIKGKGQKEDVCVACPECKVNFPFLDIQSHYKTCVFKTINCPWCNKQFKGTESGSLQLHKKIMHFWGVFRCIQCKYKANFAKDLIKHMEEEEHMENPYACCPNCRQEFPMLDLGAHYEICVVDKYTKCQWCNEKFSAGGALYKHKKTVHFWGTFKCPQCSGKFNFARDLVDHMQLDPHLNAILKDHKINCPHCANKYLMNDITSHYEECVVGGYKLTKCSKCKKILPKEKLLSHQDVCVALPASSKARKVRPLVRVAKKNVDKRVLPHTTKRKIVVLHLKKVDKLPVVPVLKAIPEDAIKSITKNAQDSTDSILKKADKSVISQKLPVAPVLKAIPEDTVKSIPKNAQDSTDSILKKADKSVIPQKLPVAPVLKAIPKDAVKSIPKNAQDSTDSIKIPSYDEYMEYRRRTVPSASNQCCVCSLTFEDISPKMEHMKKVHCWGFFRCPVCSKKENFAKDLIEHMIEKEHPGDLRCPKCRAKCAMMDFEAHYGECVKPLKERNKEESKICETCGKTVPRVRFRAHVRQYHSDHGKSRNHCCDKCGKRYNTPGHLREHIKSAHDGIKKPRSPATCPICLQTFKSAVAMNCHRNIEHYHKYQCNDCGKYFGNNSRLEIHRNIEHDHKYQCHHCGKNFGAACNLEQHSKWHKEPKFPCKFCDKMFKLEQSLETHERMHTGEKPFPCLLCDSKFASSAGLNQHKRGVHKIAPRGGRTDWYRREKDRNG